MKKLKLNVETLRVQSFDATPAAPVGGLTAAATRPLVCDPATVPPRCA